ncbi:MAG TPA: hypothetical protein VHJ76_05115 [Actinomycetota bacterium]|nr:hypothetical protein [Actinomycetota bacterium]
MRYWLDQGVGSNHGWRISPTPGANAGELRGYSPKEAWDGNRRPYLTVAVNAFPSTRSFVMDDPDFPYLDLATDASPNGTIVGGGVQPVLKIKDLTDSNLDPIVVRYQVSKSATDFSGANLLHDSGWVPETHQRSVNVDGWAPGVYYWRVQASDTCADAAYRDVDNAAERNAHLCDDLSHAGRTSGRNTSEIRTFMIEDPVAETRDCTAAETYCRGLVASSADSDDRENASRSLVPVSAPGEVLIVTANLRMAHCKIIMRGDGSNICDGVPQDVTPDDKTDNTWEYKADQAPAARQRHFGRRIKILARRALGGGPFEDGTGAAPDVVLLQEAWVRNDGRNDVEGIRAALSEKTGVPYRIAIQQTEGEKSTGTRDMAQGEDVTVETKGDTAILYNARTMEAPIETGKIKNEWDPQSSTGERLICDDKSRSLLELDLDGDGSRDCSTAQQKVQVYAGMYKKDGDGNAATKGPLTAVASVHYVLDNDFKDDAVAEEHKARWSEQIATKLDQRFAAEIFAIGGDFNAQRCPKREEPRVPVTNAERNPEVQERSICQNIGGEEPFWDALSAKGYVDTVYKRHGAPPGTDTTLTAQYKDGVLVGTKTPRYRDVRIDSIFVRTSGRVVRGASHDQTCGYYGDAGMSNCDIFVTEKPWKYPYDAGCTCSHRIPTSPDRYSDHRLVWTLVGL